MSLGGSGQNLILRDRDRQCCGRGRGGGRSEQQRRRRQRLLARFRAERDHRLGTRRFRRTRRRRSGTFDVQQRPGQHRRHPGRLQQLGLGDRYPGPRCLHSLDLSTRRRRVRDYERHVDGGSPRRGSGGTSGEHHTGGGGGGRPSDHQYSRYNRKRRLGLKRCS